jgi:hypothetical protein
VRKTLSKRPSKRTKKPPVRELDAPSRDPIVENGLVSVPYVLDSPHAILDEALADAARTVASAAQGSDISREQLAAAQDILNRKGITSATKSSAIPEAFARDAFATVFRLLGFPPIRWPRALVEKPQTRENESVDAFNKALADV